MPKIYIDEPTHEQHQTPTTKGNKPSSTKEQLVSGKGLMPRPSISQLIDEKTWENEQLLRELQYQQSKYRVTFQARTFITEEVKRTIESLQQTLSRFEKLQKHIEDESRGRQDQSE